MKKDVPAPFSPSHTPRSEQGSVRTVVVLLVFFCLGLAVGAMWLHAPRKATEAKPELTLSPSTQTVLEHLNGPVELRFYSLLDPNSPATLQAYAGRVRQLLAAYQQAGSGKVVLTEQTNADPNNASAEGIRGFDLDKGQGCYLGLALTCGGKKEVLPQLYPAWEAALEPDVSRAIERVSAKAAPPLTTTPIEEASSALVESLKSEIPNFDSVPLEEALRVARTQSIEAFTSATKAMNSMVLEAQADLAKAQKQGSKADQDAAAKKLQDIQSIESQKLKEIAAESQARIDLIKKLKTAGN